MELRVQSEATWAGRQTKKMLMKICNTSGNTHASMYCTRTRHAHIES